MEEVLVKQFAPVVMIFASIMIVEGIMRVFMKFVDIVRSVNKP